MSKIQLRHLVNGLPVILVPHQGTEATCVLALVRAGSRLEARTGRGLSHFLEHMVFKGTERRPTARDLTQLLDGVGADYNAYTAKEYTGYYIKTDARHLSLSLDVLSDMLWHSRLLAEEMEREKKVIIEEINMYEDNPLMYIGDVLENALFSGSALGELISGTRQSVAALSRSQLLDFWWRYYHPANMLLVVSGQLPATALADLSRVFGHQKRAGSLGRFKSFRPAPRRPNVALHFKDTEQVQLALGFPAYGWGDRRLPALKLLATVLGGNMSSRLFVRLREREGLCYSIQAAVEVYAGTGLLAVQAGLDRQRLNLAIRLIREELARVAQTGVGGDELKRAKEYSRGRLTLALEDSATQAEWYGKRWFLERSLEPPQHYFQRLNMVTSHDLKAAARQVLQPARATLALIGPFRKPEPWRRLMN
ncbi:MAG: insulinase family protein [Candidatus Kerfeldbacteria bacterium]|nr:insulinase family protein [Candidatus Kerfeldbacteria bacterium]